MRQKGNTILGISPGTRTIGYAIMRDSDLIEWRLKTFRGAWSKQKLSKIIKFIEFEIEKYKVNGIGLKMPHPKRSSTGLNQLSKGITKLKGADIKRFTINDLTVVRESEKNSKNEMIKRTIAQYPFLAKEFNRPGKTERIDFAKVIEAVCITELITENCMDNHLRR